MLKVMRSLVTRKWVLRGLCTSHRPFTTFFSHHQSAHLNSTASLKKQEREENEFSQHQTQRENWRSLFENAGDVTGAQLDKIRQKYMLSDVQYQAIREKYERLKIASQSQDMDEASFLRNELQMNQEKAEIQRASNFKYCVGLSHDLEEKRKALQKRLHKVVAMRNILLKQSISEKGEAASPSLLTKSEGAKIKPPEIDMHSANQADLESYLKSLFQYSLAQKNEAFSEAVEYLNQAQITPLIWTLKLEDNLRSNLRKALYQLRNAKTEYLENYLSPQLIALLFEKSIAQDSKEGLELLLRLAHDYSFDLSHLNLERLSAPLDFHLSKLGPAFDPSYSTLYLQFYLHQQSCFLALQKDLKQDINLPALLKFATQFYKEVVPRDSEGQDILLNTVFHLANTNQLDGLEDEISTFLMTRLQSATSSHIILHSTLKQAPYKLTQLVISKLKDFQHQHHYLPFSEDALRHFYLNFVKKESQLKCGELWAYMFREMGMTAQLFDLATSWEVITGEASQHMPTFYLTDALLSLDIDTGTAHKQIAETCKKFEIVEEHPVRVVSTMKAYLKQGQPQLAAELASKLVKQSEAEQAHLASVYKQNFGDLPLSRAQFSNRYGTLLKKLKVQQEFEPLIKLVSEVLQRKDYVSLKWLYNFFAAAHRRATLLEEIQELKHQKGSQKSQIKGRMVAAERQSKLLEQSRQELELIDKKRLKQLQTHIERKEFLKAAGRSVDLGEELIALNKSSQKELISALHSQVEKPRHSELGSSLYTLSDYLDRKAEEALAQQALPQEQVKEEEGEVEIISEPEKVKEKTLHQEVMAELRGLGIKRGTPEYTAMYLSGMLIGQAERGELAGKMESKHAQLEKKEFILWMEAEAYLRVISNWLQEYQPLLKRGLSEGSFENYVWDYVVDPPKSGFLASTLQRGLFLKTTELSQKELGEMLLKIINTPELGENNLLYQMKNLSSKLPKQFEKVLFKLREERITLRDTMPSEIKKYTKLHPRDQKVKINHHKLETQRLMSKIIYSAGMQADLDAIRGQFKQVASALDKKQAELDQMDIGEEEKVRGIKAKYEGEIDPQLSKELLGFLMLRSQRNKIRLERVRARVQSLKRSETAEIHKYGSAAKLFKEIVRVHYLQDLNTHGYLSLLPGITEEEIKMTVRDKDVILQREIAQAKRGSYRLTLDAAQLYKQKWLEEEVEKEPDYRFDIEKQKLGETGNVRVESIMAASGRVRKRAVHWKREKSINPFRHKEEPWIHVIDFTLDDKGLTQVNTIRRAVEKVNLLYAPLYDSYDPHIMRQAAFNTSLLKLKPLLLSQFRERKEIAQSYIKAQFTKLAKDTTFQPERYELSSTGDVEYRDNKLELKDMLLSLQKISVMVDDERSPLAVALQRYAHLKEITPLDVAQRVSDQSLLVEQHTLQELYADLTEKELLMAALQNHYLDLLSENQAALHEVAAHRGKLKIVQEIDPTFEEVIDRIYEEYEKVAGSKQKKLKKENKSRKKHGLKEKESLESDQTEVPLVREMLGVEGRWDQYGQEMMEFGIRQNIPSAVRIGEYLMRGKTVNRGLAKRVNEFLENAQVSYNETMQLTGPLPLQALYPEKQGYRGGSSLWRDGYTKWGGLERIIPLQQVEEIQKLDRRFG